MTAHISPMIDRARRLSLCHPTQRAPFDHQQWQDAYKTYTDGSLSDRSICEGAGWLANHFGRVFATRDHFKLRAGDEISAKELIHMHLALANLSYVLLANKHHRDLPPESVPTLETLLDYKTNLTVGSVELKPNQVSMFNLDSACSPLHEIFKSDFNIDSLLYEGTAESVSVDRYDFIAGEIRCAQLYYNGLNIWQQLLYGDAIFAYDGRTKKIVVAQLSQMNRMRAISDRRREHHQVSTAFEMSRVINNTEIRFDSVYPDHVLTLDDQSGFVECSVSKCDEESLRFIRYKWVEQHLAVEPHLLAMLEIQSAPDGDAASYSVRDVLKIWGHLAFLAMQIFNRSDDANPQEWDQLAAYCTWFDRENLVAALARMAGVRSEAVSAIFDLLTYRGADRQDDLWAKPIVEIEGAVAFAIPALLTASMRRNVDIWTQTVDPNSSLRGKHFEKHLQKVMEECRSFNPIIGNSLKWTDSLMLKYKGANKEEVDLTFNFGNVVVVAEARSRRMPITPLDYHNALHEKKSGILAKAAQAERKAAYVRKHLAEFCAQHYPHLTDSLSEVKVYALVLVNDQFHAGFPSSKTPVLDEALLKHFLKDGQARFWASPHDESDFRYGVVFYESLAEAESAFPEYVLRPTIVEAHDLSVKEISTTFDALGDGEPPIQWLSHEIQEPDAGRQLEVLKKLSVGRLTVKY
ncbi:hypothetical protein [Pseudomonas syringae group sp. J309-1]|uniref:hypothetical protein n=1 Tax=Pseudomonas syringae group sp. J309-1 TaxID=3079588 RepID=UPI0029147BD4|nr:hypothetical protein [Pseudomonas syringae group sp. J309-1]MDU8357643.1 hypothetical protein [Pseudomonas syringae group sp. J309-1]